jgi:LacI family transcriptional regulator
MAVGVFRAARMLALRIPDELALTGGDDVDFAEFLEVPLTTFHLALRDVGARAAEIVLARINGESETLQQVVLRPTLVVRRSSGNKIA